MTINSGSSSLKPASYEMGEKEALVLAVEVDRIGIPGSRMRITNAHGTTLLDRQSDLPDHSAALQAFFTWFELHDSYQGLDGVGHRIVHGGHHREPQLITPDLMTALEELVPIDPDHLPQAISGIRFVRQSYPAWLRRWR